jgi:predicted solute-binding protein
MTRVAAERDFQKDSVNSISDKTGVDKKIIRRMAKVYFKANYSQEQEENRNFEEFYDGVMK